MVANTPRLEYVIGRNRTCSLTGIFENPQTPVSATIERVIYSFHMPLFMFISGFLFYFTKISRDLAYKECGDEPHFAQRVGAGI